MHSKDVHLHTSKSSLYDFSFALLKCFVFLNPVKKKKKASFFIRYSNPIQKERRKQNERLTNIDDPLCTVLHSDGWRSLLQTSF